MSVTDAPGTTAPVGSVTVPATTPLPSWAKAWNPKARLSSAADRSQPKPEVNRLIRLSLRGSQGRTQFRYERDPTTSRGRIRLQPKCGSLSVYRPSGHPKG